MSVELMSMLGLVICLAPALVHGPEVISPMLSRWVVNLILPLFGPGLPNLQAGLTRDEQLAMLDAARAAGPAGKDVAVGDYLFLLLFEQRQIALASLSVAAAVVYGLTLGLEARLPLHLLFGVMSVMFAVVNFNHAGFPGLGEHPRVSRHGRNVGISFAPIWAASAVFNLLVFFNV